MCVESVLQIIILYYTHLFFVFEQKSSFQKRDLPGRFVYGTIMGANLENTTCVKIHYDGWSRKWDCFSDFCIEGNRFAKAGSISRRPAHRLKNINPYRWVDLNPLVRHPGWCIGEVRKLDGLLLIYIFFNLLACLLSQCNVIIIYTYHTYIPN